MAHRRHGVESLSMTIYSLLSTQESKTGNRLDITEKLLTGAERINRNKLQEKFIQNTPEELHMRLKYTCSRINQDHFVASDSCI